MPIYYTFDGENKKLKQLINIVSDRRKILVLM